MAISASARTSEGKGNLLADDEWRGLLECALAINQATSGDDLRYQALAYLARAVPFQCAAFFLAKDGANRNDGCLVAQPAGAEVPAEEFEHRFKIAWNVVGAEEEQSGMCAFLFDFDERAGWTADRKLEVGEHLAGCALSGEQGHVGAVVLCRTGEQGPFDERDLAVLAALSPHLANRIEALDDRAPTSEARLVAEYGLTPREASIMSCIGFGMTSPEIAERLSIANATVKKHLERIYRKTGVNNRMSLMRLALQYRAR